MVRPTSLLKAVLLAATASASAIISARQDDNHWVSTWTSMPQLVEPNNLPPNPFVSASPTSILSHQSNIRRPDPRNLTQQLSVKPST
jgi:hypothetical protein